MFHALPSLIFSSFGRNPAEFGRHVWRGPLDRSGPLSPMPRGPVVVPLPDDWGQMVVSLCQTLAEGAHRRDVEETKREAIRAQMAVAIEQVRADAEFRAQTLTQLAEMAADALARGDREALQEILRWMAEVGGTSRAEPGAHPG